MTEQTAPGLSASASGAICGQCGRPAVAALGGNELCVDCFYKFEVARTMGARLAIIGMNHAAAEMDHITGLGNFSPKMQVPELPQAPIILNNIKVDNSVVGSINTANVQTIDVSITYLSSGGNAEISDALQKLTEAIANEPALAKSDKDGLLDQVAYLSKQAAGAAKERKPGMIKAAIAAINQTAATIAAVSAAWSSAGPIIKSFFGMS